MTQLLTASFTRVPIIGILRGYGREETNGILDAYGAAGLTAIEITLNTPKALDIINEQVSRYGESLKIGAGTVCSIKDLENALDAGAGFIVTPILDISVIQHCREIGVPVFPGAFTATEIFRAWEAGASMVKLFPADQLGPAYIKQILAPLDTIKLLPTGGIGLDNIEAYLQAGASGFGLGSSLFDQQLINEKDWTGLRRHFEKFVALFGNRP